jgi:hypothetical protein
MHCIAALERAVQVPEGSQRAEFEPATSFLQRPICQSPRSAARRARPYPLASLDRL